jgi:hypothetical protein
MNKADSGNPLAEAFRRLSPLAAPFLAMFAWFWIVAHWFPLREGRDMATYFLWFRDLFQIEPEFPLLMLFRTPLTPLFYGTCFEYLEETGIELVLALSYAGSITCLFAVLREFSCVAAWALNVLVGVNLWLFRSFNAVGSETLQTVLLCLWFCWTFFAMRSTRVRDWAGSAVLVFLLVLNRPGNQTFVLCFLLPLVIANASAVRRVMLSGVFLIVYSAFHLTFCSFNYLRYGEFCVAKLGDAHLPFYRLFVQEHVISPENGPASRELAQLVDEKILTSPTYAQYEITRDVFFRCSTQRMFNSLIFAFQKDGSNGDFSLLRKTGWESIWHDPRGSLLRYLEHLVTVFDYRDRKPFKISNLRDIARAFVRERDKLYARYAAKGLALPTEGDLIPSTSLFAAHEGRRLENWLGLQRTVKEWRVSSTPPLSSPGGMLFEISRKLIPNYYWFLFGGLCLLLARLAGPVEMRIPLLTGIALISLLVTLFGSVQWEFRYPSDPIFTAFALYAAHGAAAWFRKFTPAYLSSRLAALRKRLAAGFRRLKLAR